jgi:hypothetical protein
MDTMLEMWRREAVVSASWLPVIGPVCRYWEEEEAPICGHGSCYAIQAVWEAESWL